jgi:hypothetical protein
MNPTEQHDGEHEWTSNGGYKCTWCGALAGSSEARVPCSGPPEATPAEPSFSEKFDRAMRESAVDRMDRMFRSGGWR